MFRWCVLPLPIGSVRSSCGSVPSSHVQPSSSRDPYPTQHHREHPQKERTSNLSRYCFSRNVTVIFKLERGGKASKKPAREIAKAKERTRQSQRLGLRPGEQDPQKIEGKSNFSANPVGKYEQLAMQGLKAEMRALLGNHVTEVLNPSNLLFFFFKFIAYSSKEYSK